MKNNQIKTKKLSEEDLLTHTRFRKYRKLKEKINKDYPLKGFPEGMRDITREQNLERLKRLGDLMFKQEGDFQAFVRDRFGEIYYEKIDRGNTLSQEYKL